MAKRGRKPGLKKPIEVIKSEEFFKDIENEEVIKEEKIEDDPIYIEYTMDDIEKANLINIEKYNFKKKRSRLLVLKDIHKLFKDLETIQPRDLLTIKHMFNLHNEYYFPNNQNIDYTCKECIIDIYQKLKQIYEKT